MHLTPPVLKTDPNKTDISGVKRDRTVEGGDQALMNVVDRMIDDDNVVVQALTRTLCNGRADCVLHLVRDPQREVIVVAAGQVVGSTHLVNS